MMLVADVKPRGKPKVGATCLHRADAAELSRTSVKISAGLTWPNTAVIASWPSIFRRGDPTEATYQYSKIAAH